MSFGAFSQIDSDRLNRRREFVQLREVVEHFAEIATDFGVKIEAFSEASLARLATMPDTDIQRVLSHFASYHAVVVDAIEKRIDLNDSKAFVTTAMKYMGIRPHADFLNTVESEDIVELYDINNRQIFRNLRLYELTKYSLGDLIAFEWPELYQRASSVTERLLGRVVKALEGDGQIVQMNDIDPHIMKEFRLNPPQIFEVMFKSLGPIYNDIDGQKSGIFALERGRCLGNVLVESKIDFI